MKALNAFMIALGIAATGATMVSCGHDDDSLVGKWTSSAPEVVTESVTGASSAVRTLTFDFTAPTEGTTGDLTLTANYDVTDAAATDSVAAKYTVVATIKGKWSQDVDDHDDYLLQFDRNSLSVTGTDAPVLGPVTDSFLNSLSAFTSIEDVEQSKDKQHLTFETKNPEVKYHLVSSK